MITPTIVSGRSGAKTSPRGIVVVGGYQARFEHFTVEQNGFSAADTFDIGLPWFIRDQQNGEPVLANGPEFSSLLVTADTVPVQVYVGYPNNPLRFTTSDLTKIMDGQMDTARWSVGLNGEGVTISGRNKTGMLIDTKILQKYPNLTSSAIATMFANEHGLTPVVTATTALAGTYYNNQSAALGTDISEWDLLLYLAKRENFVVRVRGNTLLFGPYSSVVGVPAAIVYTYGYDIQAMDLERSPHAAKNIAVTVLSFDRNKKQQIKEFKETAASTTQFSTKIQGQIGQRAKYSVTYTIPGLTRQQAQNRAAEILASLSRTQIIGSITTAGNTSLTTDGQVELNGCGQGLDQRYYINRVTHTFDANNGYTMDIGLSTQTDYNTAGSSTSVGEPVTGSGVSLAAAAQGLSGKQFWPNSCAFAVNQVLTAAGINLGLSNPNYAPEYQGIGTTITNEGDLMPGDLVLTDWGYDATTRTYDAGHIGIYAWGGKMWNVSTSNGYKWTLTNIVNFHQGQRITQ